MPRIPSKKTQRHRLIVDCLSVDMSGNKIQKLLQEEGLGIRRKKLYEEIRAIKYTKTKIIKGKKVTVYEEPKGLEEKRKKSIPKKYRKKDIAKKKWIDRTKKIGSIYRGSLIISDVPLHSKPFNRQYLGFRLNIFSYDKNEVKSALKSMKDKFIEMVADKKKGLGSEAYAKETWHILGTEKVVKITIADTDYLNGKWFFAIEEKGRDIDGGSGRI